MKNVFFKREDALHYKHSIFRQKKRCVLIVFLVCAVLFFFYQILFMSQLSRSQLIVVEKEKTKPTYHTSKPLVLQVTDVFNDKGLVKGTRLSDLSKYKPNSNGKFTCFKSRMEIDFFLVNDNYCDCPEDGSDEPGTNACNDGRFYCKYHPKHHRTKENVIPSSRVNDGICDCCDGSDEWNRTSNPQALPLDIQKKLGRYQVPCPNVCL